MLTYEKEISELKYIAIGMRYIAIAWEVDLITKNFKTH
jgi:hypothetical protein